MSSLLGFWVIICQTGLCGEFDLEVMRSDRAIFRKFRGTNDKWWLWLRLCNCGAVGVVFVPFRDSSYAFVNFDSLVLYSFI